MAISETKKFTMENVCQHIHDTHIHTSRSTFFLSTSKLLSWLNMNKPSENLVCHNKVSFLVMLLFLHHAHKSKDFHQNHTQTSIYERHISGLTQSSGCTQPITSSWWCTTLKLGLSQTPLLAGRLDAFDTRLNSIGSSRSHIPDIQETTLLPAAFPLHLLFKRDGSASLGTSHYQCTVFTIISLAAWRRHQRWLEEGRRLGA